MKVYVASSWRNDYQAQVVSFLRAHGHEVYDFKNPFPGNNGFSWSAIDPKWEEWSTAMYVRALKHPVADQGYANDFNAMNEADICVMVLPCGRSASVEAGYMRGRGKPVYVLSPVHCEPELMYKMFSGIFQTGYELISTIGGNMAISWDLPFEK